ncbi:MAG: oligogalacturonate lyase family protein [Candidatus Marinimicrobia bacterium]|nr:oligogalacturonate lyase family protein [Candidatus Neomarinimicrobiota bacterium]
MTSTRTPISPESDALEPARIAALYPRVAAPGTGRAAYQLTAGPATCYPLYYFIPSITRDGRHLVYHRNGGGEVQLYRLNLATGAHAALTAADDPEPGWRPWDTDPGRGVLDHRSALNVARNEVIYVARGEARAVDVETLADRALFRLPPGRKATGQNCVSPDGRYFFYIHHDAELEARIYAAKPYARHLSKGTELARYDLDTGETHLVARLNSPFHHVHPYGDRHLIFSSPALEMAPLLTDYEGGWFTQLRTQDGEGRTTCHYAGTQRGVHYELTGNEPKKVGVLCPRTHRRREFSCPALNHLHVGFDATGRRLLLDGEEAAGERSLYSLAELPRAGEPEWQRLCGPWTTYGAGQKAHSHPRITPCGRWVQMVAGDPATRTNHVFLLDIRDVAPARGLPDFAIKPSTIEGIERIESIDSFDSFEHNPGARP